MGNEPFRRIGSLAAHDSRDGSLSQATPLFKMRLGWIPPSLYKGVSIWCKDILLFIILNCPKGVGAKFSKK